MVIRVKVKMLCGLPLAADGRHDGTLLLQFCESLIHFFAVGTKCLGHFTSGDGLARFAHGL